MRWSRLQIGVLTAGIGIASSISCSRSPARASIAWNPKTAAAYLDSREEWWNQWVGAARDHGTFCASCHTALPYALARPVLHKTLGEDIPSPTERSLVDDVLKRVRLWKETSPYYSEEGYDTKTVESRGTEVVLNALILANFDAQRGNLSPDTHTAFRNMWALQKTTGDQKGAWAWLQFDQEPWEAKNSVYYGACLAALAVGTAPNNYVSDPAIQTPLALLRTYLRNGNTSQSVINRIFLLWASTRMTDLLNAQEQKAIVDEALRRQQSDGGWRLASITWNWRTWSKSTLFKMWLREDGTPVTGKSDGVATGLIVYVLQEAGVPRANPQIQKGLSWLETNQSPEGFWPALSVNKQKHMSSNTKRFMNDAATSFAVLALTDGDSKGKSLDSAALP